MWQFYGNFQRDISLCITILQISLPPQTKQCHDIIQTNFQRVLRVVAPLKLNLVKCFDAAKVIKKIETSKFYYPGITFLTRF